MAAWGMLGGFLILFAIGMPVGLSLLAAAFLGLLLSPIPITMPMIIGSMWNGVNSTLLIAIPLFLFLGNLMIAAQITDRIVDWAAAIVGRVRGGLAQVNIIVSMVMAGFSGSDLSDVAVTGSVLIPAMKKNGYPAGYAAALTEGSATVGPLIPPSAGFILIGSVANVSVGALFLGGAMPGFILGGFLMIQAYVLARLRDFPRAEERTSLKQALATTAVALPVLLLPLMIIGGIVFAITTVTESALLGVFGAILLGLVFYRTLTIGGLGHAAYKAMRDTASILFLVVTAAAFARILILLGVANAITDFAIGLTTNPILFLMVIALLLLLIGMVMEPIGVILVLVPLLMPPVEAYGIDPVHFGVVVLFSLLIGLMTPPLGLGMFLACRIAEIEIDEFIPYAWPIVLVMVSTVFLIILVPGIVTWLPNTILQ